MTIDAKAVLDHIDTDELVKVTLDLANLDSPTGCEGPAADYVYDWLVRQGFEARKVGLYPNRPNVLATLPGTGGGRSLCFNSHLDTTIHKDEWWTTRHAADPIFHSGWREGDVLIGNGVCNCKGPMATWLLAVKAIKDSGVKLKGDLLLMSVVGEIGLEPVDEFQPPEYLAKEAGTRYAITHGGVADFALVSEGTDFDIVGVEAGKAFFKLTVFGDEPLYTPFAPPEPDPVQNPNAIVRLAPMITAFNEWAARYSERVYRCPGGTVVPKAVIGAVRSGRPDKITKSTELAILYLDIRITPDQHPMDLKRELDRALAPTGVPFDLECFLFRRGYEAEGIEPLASATRDSHIDEFGDEPGDPAPPVTSMWRDTTPFNEAGIPSLTYGPSSSTGGGNFSVGVAELGATARVYARTALRFCGIAP